MYQSLDRNKHPRDADIYMDEATHTYYLQGDPISISGTGFLHMFFDPFDSGKTALELSKKAKPGTKYHRDRLGQRKILELMPHPHVP